MGCAVNEDSFSGLLRAPMDQVHARLVIRSHFESSFLVDFMLLSSAFMLVIEFLKVRRKLLVCMSAWSGSIVFHHLYFWGPFSHQLVL